MKRKRNFYIALIIVCLCTIMSIYWMLGRGITSREIGMLTGVSSGLIGLSISRLLSLRMEKTDPALRKQNEIEQKDERNVAIRRRAKALSGDVLQWVVIGAAWLSFGFGAPPWILLLASAGLAAKALLELCLMVRYQKLM